MKNILRTGISATTFFCAVLTTSQIAAAQSFEPAQESTASETLSGTDDIVVTARRKEESAQSVPVSITAFSGESLRSAGVKSLSDLTAITPGLRFSSEGEGNTTSVTLRGLAVTPTGETLPAVVTYFSEVALPSKGVNMPTFDLENIQVLKGPQGTLFGRNTIGGAVLLTPRVPDFTTNGYIEGTYGNLDYRRFGAALNLPIIDDILAVRVAGEIKRRDGYVKDISGGSALSNIRNESIRGSILFEPTPSIRNILIVEYFNAPENPSGNVVAGISPGIATIEQFFDAPTGGNYAQQIRDFAARQQAMGPFKVDYGLDGKSRRHGIAMVNTTTIDLTDDISLKNIFGFRRLRTKILGNFAGISPAALTGPLGNFSVFIQDVDIARQLMSDEVQLQGRSFGGKLDWIVGGIYSEDKPYGSGNGSWGQIFAPFYPQPNTFVSAIFGSSSKALFAQGSLDISDWTIAGLKATAGIRYTWDDVSACSLGLSEAPGSDLLGFDRARYVSDKECRSVAKRNNPADGAGIVETSGNEPTYTLGLEWQATDKILLYFAHRHGFRGVNVNSPKFETPFTTGGNGALYAAVLDRFGGFDIVHNNAAETTPAIMNRDIAIQDMDVMLWDRSFQINARGTMLMVRGALPTLLARGGGSIINTSSGATLLGDLFLPAYAASKSAVNTLTKYVAAQYGKDNIRCNAISPGLIITQGAEHVAGRFDVYKRHTLLPELGEPGDIAAMVALLASDDGKFITGQVIAVDGGITSHFPHFADTLPGFKEAAAAQRSGL